LLATVLPTKIFLEQRRHNREMRASLEVERQARAESEDLSAILLELFDKADPAQGEPSPAVQAVLEKAVQSINRRLAEQPARRAILQSLLGRVHGNLGLWEPGLQWLQEAIQGLEACVEDPELRGGIALEQLQFDLVEAHTRYAVLIATRGRPGQTFALPHRQEAVRLLGELLGEDHWRTLTAAAEYTRLAGSLPAGTVEGHVPPPAEEVLQALRKAIASLEGVSEVDPVFRAGLLGQLGNELLSYHMTKPTRERAPALKEAEEVLIRCRAWLEEGGAKDTLDWAKATNSLALAYKQQGQLAAAEPLYLEVAATYAARLGENSVEHGMVLANTSQLLLQGGRANDGIAMLERAHGILLRALGPDHPTQVTTEANLLGILTKRSRFEGLADRYSLLIPRQQKLLGSPHAALAMSYFGRGLARTQDGNTEGAKTDLAQAIEILEALGEGQKSFARQVRRKLKALQ
jgi:tetratricopeptide (TPR) repeat protein